MDESCVLNVIESATHMSQYRAQHEPSQAVHVLFNKVTKFVSQMALQSPEVVDVDFMLKILDKLTRLQDS